MSIAEKCLQVHIVVLVILSTLLLGNGLNSLTVPILGGSAAVLAFIFTERLGWIRLNRPVANLGAIGVAAYAIYRFFQNESTGDVKLTAIANLLTFVQIILLFQQKSPRLYWNIWVLSLLQVVVAGALSLHFQVGILFFIFFLVSLSAMTVMAVYVDADALALRDGKSPAQSAKPASGQTQRRSLRIAFESLAAQDPVSVQLNPSQPVGLGRLVRMSWVAGLVTSVFAALLFYSIPRHKDAWYGPNYSKHSRVGFSASVSFDRPEQIVPSNQIVMRVQFLDDENKAKKLMVEPYFRGITLPTFECNEDGTNWLPYPPRTSPDPSEIQPNIPLDPLIGEETVLDDDDLDGDLTDGYSLVRQQVVLQSSQDRYLFSLVPAFMKTCTSDQVLFDYDREALTRDLRPDEFTDDPFHFEVTVPLYFDRPLPAIPAGPKVRDRKDEAIKPSEVKFPAVYEAAAAVVARVESKDNRALLAFRMSEYLGNNEEFTYTLNYKNVRFDRTLNPIEDFVRNHKTGHCEYYAAALALMLRTVDIPSRLVIGYKGGDFNAMGNYYEVKEKHAHVWVEAYLPVQDCSPRMLATGQASPKFGAWYRLDPTAEAVTGSEEDNSKGLVDRAGDAISYAQYVWDDYIIGMNSERQQRNLFNPNQGGLLGRIFADEDVQNQLQQFPAALRGNFWTRSARILFVAANGLVIWGVYRLAVTRFAQKKRARGVRGSQRIANVVDAVSPWLAKLMFGQSATRPVVRVDFYERFLKMLRKRGITPASHQTALEFAVSVIHRLGTADDQAEEPHQVAGGLGVSNSRTSFSQHGSLDATAAPHAQQPQNAGHPRLPAILGVITSEFYRVRFGNDSLDSARTEKVENALKELDSALALHPARTLNG